MAKLTRKCYRCKEVKDLDSFPKHSGKPLGKAYICKPCTVEKQQSLYTKEEIKAKNFKVNLKSKYNLTLDQYNTLLEEHNYMCKICDNIEDLCVDHDHTTGKVRGILCRTCNAGVGMFKDNITLIENAKEYLSE